MVYSFLNTFTCSNSNKSSPPFLAMDEACVTGSFTGYSRGCGGFGACVLVVWLTVLSIRLISVRLVRDFTLDWGFLLGFWLGLDLSGFGG